MFRNGVEIDNCHNTGDVTVDSRENAAAGQVFVGGIAGGSNLAYSTDYNGCITNSSSAGSVSAKANGSWTWAGGIAGTIVGGSGSLENSTRIYRCYAKGIVSTDGTLSSNPHAGGIVAYNYYGAWVSQCWFDGAVINAKAGDFTGGIAGYSSRYDGTVSNSRIEDCWSAGTIQGYNNAGGIVGENQIFTYVRNCYSKAAVSVTNNAGIASSPGIAGQGGIGGIAGNNESDMPDAISACVALNPSITAANGNAIHRIVGRNSTGARIANNHALSSITVTTTGGTYTVIKGADAEDGADITGALTQAFFESLTWDFTNVWKWDTVNGYPILQWQ
jgi:hypothetical protein